MRVDWDALYGETVKGSGKLTEYEWNLSLIQVGYNKGLEDAAKVVEADGEPPASWMWREDAKKKADAIRKLKEA